MVQRKAPNKLGILDDSKNDVKSGKWSLALKPSPQHQDIQDKDGAELKKKELKKSRSIKLLDLENLEPPPPTRRPKSRFQKLPTNVSTAVVTPQAPSVMKKRDPSPNYMKPTSSSDAKKERSQVSPLGYQSSCPPKSLSPSPNGRNSNRMSPSPYPSGRNSHGNSLSPSPSGRNSYRMSLSPAPSGRNSHGHSLSLSPSGRNSRAESLSPGPSGRNSYRMSMSPCPSGRNSHCKSQSPCPSGRNSNSMSPSRIPSGRTPSGISASPCPSGRNSNSMSPSRIPSGRTPSRMSMSPCPSGRNSNSMSPGRIPSGRTPSRMSASPCPSGRNSHGNSLSPTLSPRNSDHSKPCTASAHKPVKTSTPTLSPKNSDDSKPCAASAHKPVKTSTKTSSLKPVRTLTKTPSFKGGAELKKQIKKSRSIKLVDLTSLESSLMEQTKSGFDESPVNVTSAAVTPEKQSLIKTSYLLPSYMKPTSSSYARKEHLQVSTQGSQTSCPTKSPNESNLIHTKPSTASGHKPARTLMKKSSLKPLRTLTKTSSLKLARPSMKKSPDAALCSSMNAGRATCSSTLKDSNFPAFLTLSPGATESEGISAMNVCPYTYCSLNGHHHTPLPLLKHFLSARRRLLKTQKSLRLNNLPPLGKKSPGESKKETDMVRMAFNEDPTAQVVDLASSTISPVIKEDGIDFFVEIYAKPREETAMPIGRSIQDGDDEATILDGITSSVVNGTEIETENDAVKVHEKPDELSYSNPILEGNTDSEPDLMTVHLPESNSPGLQEELVFVPDDIVNSSEEFPAEVQVQQQVHAENAESLRMEYGDDHSETDAEDQSFWPGVPTNVSGEGSDTSNCPDESTFSFTDVAFEPTTIMEERDGAPKPDETNSMAYSATVEDRPEELTVSSDENDEELQPEHFLQEHPESIPITDVADDALVNKQESSSLAFSNNLAVGDVGSDAEVKKQAEDSVEHDDHGGKSSHAENSIEEEEEEEETMQIEDNTESGATETINSEDNITSSKEDKTTVDKGNNSNQELPMTSGNLKRTMRCRRPIEEEEEQRKFNPREPQYLDIEPEPEPEKVDLRHQMMDERKNSEEWMLDHALQKAVTKLAPARKRRVALLVEAFEKVIPPPKFDIHLPNTSAAFAHARPIQACN